MTEMRYWLDPLWKIEKKKTWSMKKFREKIKRKGNLLFFQNRPKKQFLTSLKTSQSGWQWVKSPSISLGSCCLSTYCWSTPVPRTMWTWTEQDKKGNILHKKFNMRGSCCRLEQINSYLRALLLTNISCLI